ncbi:helix-turn-helix domain-containing protein [Halalkalicoccus sp. NIPERK01]|uniref:helix-turn-helix domain-containing protein n=1 Tax=Halalkalicoccus sp. NIPERK01 TaxID=3053469 RepID=UPI00256F55ED|nr:helix-turn-helix domain-containing protein [Halalkalicoccus sp. NIPERK01]MDL5361415.1 helix-turn-helix domain-containing protein [Halalkalicoccus sp. NIPERK01]
MAAIIQLRFPATEATLGGTIAAVPGVRMEVEKFASAADESKRPLIWIQTDDYGAVDGALSADPTVASHAVVGEAEGRRLYELAWTDPADVTFCALERFGGHLRYASLTDGQWAVELLFPTRERLSRMYEAITERGLPITVDSIHELDEATADRPLTENQRRTLETALATGYYDIPRETTLSDLAEEMDVSHQALSERLRRAHKQLVTTALNGHPMNGPTDLETDRPHR